MHFLKTSAVKKAFHDSDRQITKDGLHAIDVKVAEFIEKAMKQFNGHHKRITAEVITLIKL